jgi:hypothetical protein
MIRKTFEISEKDIHAPSLDTSIWNSFLRNTGLMKVWLNDTNNYQRALVDYAKDHGFELMTLDNSDGEYGYIFRFKSESEKLAFLLKWV